MNKEKSIQVLNSLIEINNDRIEGYETASKETKEEDLKNLFFQFINTSKKCKTELISEVLQLGGVPIEGTKIMGKFFRVWMDFKSALTHKNRKTILVLCEYGENKALQTYNKVLKNGLQFINSDQQILLNAQRVLIKNNHDVVKSLRDTFLEFS